MSTDLSVSSSGWRASLDIAVAIIFQNGLTMSMEPLYAT